MLGRGPLEQSYDGGNGSGRLQHGYKNITPCFYLIDIIVNVDRRGKPANATGFAPGMAPSTALSRAGPALQAHTERGRERELLFKRVPEHLCLRQLIHGIGCRREGPCDRPVRPRMRR